MLKLVGFFNLKQQNCAFPRANLEAFGQATCHREGEQLAPDPPSPSYFPLKWSAVESHPLRS